MIAQMGDLVLEKPSNLILRPSDLPSTSMPEPVRLESGSIEILEGTEGYVVYGGYLALPDGLYLIDALFEAEGDFDAILDVFDHGVVLATMACDRNTSLVVDLSDVTALEVRIKAHGRPFTLTSIALRRLISTSPARPTEDIETIAVELAEAGRPDLAVTIAERLMGYGLSSAAMNFAEAGGVVGLLPALRMQMVWRSLHANLPLADWSYLLDDAHDARGGAAQAFVQYGAAPDFIDCSALDAAAASQLREFGLDASAIRLMAADRWDLEQELVGRALGASELARLQAAHKKLPPQGPFRSSLMRELGKQDHAFQLTGLILGCVVAPSPVSGAPMISRHSIVVPMDHGKQVFLFYYFPGAEPFYLGVAGWPGQKVMAYFPHKNLIVGFAHPSQSWTPYPIVIDTLKHFVLVGADRIAKYLSAPTRPAILTGTVANLGHSFWNDLSRLSQLEQAGLLNSVSAMVIYKDSFIEPTSVVAFKGELHRPKDATELTNSVYHSGLFCVRPTALSMDMEDIRRIQSAALKDTRAETLKKIELAQSHGFVLWANLRIHNKVWVDQVDGIMKMIDDLVVDYGTVAILLDGMQDCEPLVHQIRALAPSGVTIFDGTDLPLGESITWAFGVDAYVATIGSGLTLVTWLAGKPGLAHSEKEHLGQLEFWGDVRPGLARIQAPTVADVEETTGGWYSDYKIPMPIMRKLMRKAAKQAKRPRQV